jgi:hypothetical protein
MNERFGHTKKLKTFLVAPLLFATLLPASAQYQSHRDYSNNRNNQRFYSGVRNGGRGGQYYDDRRSSNYNYNERQVNQGGIGPGKGALIGAGGGAVLGALFGGGLKGTIIGGAAGAGVGAVVGKVHQDNKRNDLRNDQRNAYYNNRPR